MRLRDRAVLLMDRVGIGVKNDLVRAARRRKQRQQTQSEGSSSVEWAKCELCSFVSRRGQFQHRESCPIVDPDRALDEREYLEPYEK